jgi:hypothetical protein
MVIVALSLVSVPSQGAGISAGLPVLAATGKEAQPVAAVDVAKETARVLPHVAEATMTVDDDAAAAKLKAQQRRRDAADERFGNFMLFLQVLRGQK